MSIQTSNRWVTIRTLFSADNFFDIPDYQRPYSWGEDEAGDLVDDLIMASQEKEKDYFIGTIVLHASGDRYSIVDGQQRITALTLLFAYIRDRIGEKSAAEIQELLVQPEKAMLGIPERQRLEVRSPSEYAKIVGTMGGARVVRRPPHPAKNVAERYRLTLATYDAALKDFSESELQELCKFVISHVVVIQLVAVDFREAFQLFTVVNDRGKQLRRVDVLKAQNLSPEAIDDANVRTEYSRKWEAIEVSLGEAEFERLFNVLRLLYVKGKPQGDLLHEFSVRVYGKRGMPRRGRNFVDELGAYAELYQALFVDQDFLEGEVDQNIQFASLMPLMVDRLPFGEWKSCILLYGKKFRCERILDFLYHVERVSVDLWVRGVRKDERYGVYTDLLGLLGESKTVDDFHSLLNEVDLSEIREACRSERFYNMKYAGYLLARAELCAAELSEPRVIRPKSIEHVLPQAPADDSEWVKLFTDEERRGLVHCSGNLVLLSRQKNSRAQNREFAAKKEVYLAPRVSDYPRSIEVLSYDRWTPDIVRKRRDDFVCSVMSPLRSDG
ncbi:MAG: DUF262 domain-containing protein [Actinomyces succiniciruminis]|nr:DUF262 domain-containing protein [Actinomyces succiniciruminis]